MCVELSCTLQKGSGSALPPACAVGGQRVALPLVGRGSARVYSPPLAPQVVLDEPFVGLDLGAEGQPFTSQRLGMMRLYGADVDLDWRRLVAFGRTISLVDADEYDQVRPPSKVDLPADLTCPNLEYSGIYEDGWMGEAFYAWLSATATTRALRLRGLIPQTDQPAYEAGLTVCLDGQQVLRQRLRLGGFDLRIPVATAAGKHRIDLRWDRTQVFAAPDLRPVAARLEALGFDDDGATGAAGSPPR
jgi:hypothetical protein